MIRVTPILLVLCLTACSGLSMPLAPRPQIPELTAAIKDPCPPADLLADGSLATLTRSDASLALEYARCREKHLAAVAAYELARSKLNGRPPRGKPKDGG